MQQRRARKKRYTIISHMENKHVNSIKNNNDIIIEDWLLERLADKLRNASIIVHRKYTPHLLYRNTIEENEDALQEEVGLLTEKYVLIVKNTYGGFIPSNFQKVEVYTLDKFTKWIVQEQRKELLLQCLKNLE
jgi:hypothetical protein